MVCSILVTWAATAKHLFHSSRMGKGISIHSSNYIYIFRAIVKFSYMCSQLVIPLRYHSDLD
jgi:hypothetical protein